MIRTKISNRSNLYLKFTFFVIVHLSSQNPAYIQAYSPQFLVCSYHELIVYGETFLFSLVLIYVHQLNYSLTKFCNHNPNISSNYVVNFICLEIEKRNKGNGFKIIFIIRHLVIRSYSLIISVQFMCNVLIIMKKPCICLINHFLNFFL